MTGDTPQFHSPVRICGLAWVQVVAPALHDAVVAEFAGHAETVWTGTTICTTIDSAGANADRNDGSRAPDGYRIRAESYFYTDPLECHTGSQEPMNARFRPCI